MNKTYLISIPLIFIVFISGMFLLNLNFEEKESLIVSDIPSFELQTLQKRKIDQSIFEEGEFKLINVWATWCINCKLEHGFLMNLKNQDIKIIGLNYKDDLEKAKKWLIQFGNPYYENVFDPLGNLGFELGVAGAPETYLVSKKNKILVKHIGIMNDKIWLDKFQSFLND